MSVITLNTTETENNTTDIFVVTATTRTDDYKRPNVEVQTFSVSSRADAENLTAQLYLENARDFDVFYSNEELKEGLLEGVAELRVELANEDDVPSHDSVAEYVIAFFEDESHLFEGEYVDTIFEVDFESQEVATINNEDTINSLLEGLAEG
jgi:hypothetical protein